LPSQAEVHIIDRLNSLLPYLGCPEPERRIEIDLPKDYMEKAELALGLKAAGEKRLAINISGSTDEKYIGVEKHIELLVELESGIPESKGWDIILFGTFKHIGDLERIRDGAGGKTELNVRYAPITKNFRLYMAMLSTADMLLTPDTAAVHIAAAFGIPVAVYYTLPPDAPERMPWYPVGIPYEAIVNKGDVRGIGTGAMVGMVGKLITNSTP
jgi:ADP-heptose:LPS heptosyltransferase